MISLPQLIVFCAAGFSIRAEAPPARGSRVEYAPVVPDWHNLRRIATAERTGRLRLHGDKTSNIGGCLDPCRLACHGATEKGDIRDCRPAHTGQEQTFNA
jgi:hypothetical protein